MYMYVHTHMSIHTYVRGQEVSYKQHPYSSSHVLMG